MFEVGFSEICMVMLVALLVIGPEKLPKFARMAGFWIAKSKRVLASVEQEIHEEFQAEELRQTLKDQTGVNEFQNFLEDASKEFNSIKDAAGQQPHASYLNQNTADRDERK